jgi:hypothetical protein
MRPADVALMRRAVRMATFGALVGEYEGVLPSVSQMWRRQAPAESSTQQPVQAFQSASADASGRFSQTQAPPNPQGGGRQQPAQGGGQQPPPPNRDRPPPTPHKTTTPQPPPPITNTITPLPKTNPTIYPNNDRQRGYARATASTVSAAQDELNANTTDSMNKRSDGYYDILVGLLNNTSMEQTSKHAQIKVLIRHWKGVDPERANQYSTFAGARNTKQSRELTGEEIAIANKNQKQNDDPPPQ